MHKVHTPPCGDTTLPPAALAVEAKHMGHAPPAGNDRALCNGHRAPKLLINHGRQLLLQRRLQHISGRSGRLAAPARRRRRCRRSPVDVHRARILRAYAGLRLRDHQQVVPHCNIKAESSSRGRVAGKFGWRRKVGHSLHISVRRREDLNHVWPCDPSHHKQVTIKQQRQHQTVG